MYGVDVISCLNKAIDNNDKYFDTSGRLGFLTEGRHPKDYVIDVFVKINNNKLEESLEVKKIDERNYKEVTLYDSAQTSGISMSSVFKDITFSNSYTGFRATDNIQTVSKDFDLGSTTGYYSLLKEDLSGYNESNLYKLLGFASKNMKITVRNNDSSTLGKWSSCTWTTALYNLKTKRFKCDEIKYNQKTGRINAIYFSEL